MYSLFIYSFVISLFIFGVLQYIEKNNRDKEIEKYDVYKHLLTTNNIIIFLMIFLSCLILLYFVLNDNTDLLTSLGIFEDEKTNRKVVDIKESIYDVKKNMHVDPTMLKRINDPLKYGFEPYNSASDDNSSVSSSSDSNDSNSTEDD